MSNNQVQTLSGANTVMVIDIVNSELCAVTSWSRTTQSSARPNAKPPECTHHEPLKFAVNYNDIPTKIIL